jgi:hypothetical protein
LLPGEEDGWNEAGGHVDRAPGEYRRGKRRVSGVAVISILVGRRLRRQVNAFTIE